MKKMLLAGAVALLHAGPAAAAVMTFDNLGGEYASPFSTYTENGFTLTLTSGYATKASNGPSPPGVVNYGFNVGYSLTASGNPFTFEGFGLNVASSNGTNYQVAGTLNGVAVFAYAGSLGDTSGLFPLQASPSSAAVDRVTLRFDNFGRVQGASTLDNVGATMASGTVPTGGVPAVPEPSTWATLVIGFGLIGAAKRRRRPARPACA